MAVLKLNKENFKKEIGDSKGITLVDFYATWCGPCKMIAPVIEEVAKEREEILIGKVDVDEENELAATYNVMSIPTLIVFKDGKEYARTLGYKSKQEILDLLS